MGAHTNLLLLYLHKLLQTGLNRLVFKSSKQSTSTKHSNHQKRTNRTLAPSNRGQRWGVALGLKVREFMFPNLFYTAFPSLSPCWLIRAMYWYPDRTCTCLLCFNPLLYLFSYLFCPKHIYPKNIWCSPVRVSA